MYLSSSSPTGIRFLAAGMDPGANAAIVAIPMLLMGLGLGALSSHLGAITVSAVPDAQSDEVGGLQNTATTLGASLGTALIGSVLFTTLTASFMTGVQDNPEVPTSVQEHRTSTTSSRISLQSGLPSPLGHRIPRTDTKQS